MAVPASLYVPSARAWSGRLRSPEYASGVAVRRVRTNGEIKWRGELVWLSSVLVGEPVGIEEGEDGVWRVRFGPVLLGTIDAERPPAAAARRSRCELSGGSPHERRGPRTDGELCYPSCRIELLPIIPVAQRHGLSSPPPSVDCTPTGELSPMAFLEGVRLAGARPDTPTLTRQV